MSKRNYNIKLRQQEAQKAKSRILDAAKALFESEGFAKVTIEKIAASAKVSEPSVYGIFKSKRGILLALMDSAFSEEKRLSLVQEVIQTTSASRRLELSAKIARQLYDAEKEGLNLLRGASIVDPILKELEAEREARRYERQKETTEQMAAAHAFKENLSVTEVRDILWAFTGRDLYKLFVIERGWPSDRYESWLAEALKESLLNTALIR